ncbi:NADPH-dependent FMN reductase [Kocuria palustris]|uniref:NADPH-dependent FMN reductase n=1 Tax=Kocuria palustris TaxID=71999 RepID=UPI0011A8BE09|nr:NAD(P)H-dependent oxidoreductase [Kocuria palustris]
MRIGIIVGSVRDEQNGAAVGRWVLEHARAKGGAEFELVSLKDYELPVLTSATLPAMAGKSYDSQQVQAWSDAIDALDGYIFVTPEYNHGVPGGFKNAVDSLGPEWNGKVLGLVGYGAVGGVRAVEQWRLIMANFSQTVVRAAVDLSLFVDFADGAVVDSDPKVATLHGMIDEMTAARA